MARSKLLSILLATLGAHQALALIPSKRIPIAQTNQLSTTFWEDYASGALGSNPQITYKTTSVTSPLLHHTHNSSQYCDASSLTLLSPSNTNTALLLDGSGNLVYAQKEAGTISNFRIQNYKSAPYLTYWTGDAFTHWHHGVGYYKMLDTSYNLAYVITTVGHGNEVVSGDFHDFSITADDTALVTAYVKTPWNLTAKGGKEDGWVWDCVVQEIDVATNALIFEWRASKHFAFGDVAVDSWSSWTGTEADPWDFFHINSATKDARGNYLIAAKFSKSVVYVSGVDGSIIWELGGRGNIFDDLSQGNASRFFDPHHATFDTTSPEEAQSDDVFTLTVFDTVAHFLEGRHEVAGSYPMASKIQLHMNYQGRNGTHVAKSIAQFVDAEIAGPILQGGSVQKLDSGKYLVGYGSQTAFAEFTATGELLCRTQYAPLTTTPEEAEKSLTTSPYSHRIYQTSQWTGHPSAAPSFVRDGNNLAWSWNGATEVHHWKLEGQQQAPNTELLRSRRGTTSTIVLWTQFGIFEHAGFETSVQLPASGTVSHTETGGQAMGEFDSFRLTALASDGKKVLGSWIMHDDGSVHVVVEPAAVVAVKPSTPVVASVHSATASLLRQGRKRVDYSGVGVLGLLVILVACWIWRRRCGMSRGPQRKEWNKSVV